MNKYGKMNYSNNSPILLPSHWGSNNDRDKRFNWSAFLFAFGWFFLGLISIIWFFGGF